MVIAIEKWKQEFNDKDIAENYEMKKLFKNFINDLRNKDKKHNIEVKLYL